MGTRKASKATWKHIVCSIILLILFVLFTHNTINAEGYTGEVSKENTSDTIPLYNNVTGVLKQLSSANNENEVEAGPKEEVTVYISNIDYYITTYAAELEFFAKTFGVDEEDILNDIRERYNNNSDKEFDETNIGYLTNGKGELKTFTSVEYGIVEYFYDYIEKHPSNISTTRVPYTGNAEYVENLIIYFTTHVYTNVDTSLALSIGASESGYYKAKSMLKVNNVFGGMSSNGLIKYKNIEYGVLSYIKILSEKYYDKGLNTISSIGRIYCPTYDNDGNKIASPHWINLVKTAKKKYDSYDFNLSIEDIMLDYKTA
jgi:hypothetical protein